MAGGKSSRMGSDKGRVMFKGKEMVEYAIELLSGIFNTVVISANNIDYTQYGLKLIPDIYRNCGPIGGLHAVLSNIETEYAFILSCDMPLISNSTITQIVNTVSNQKVIVPVVDDYFQPLCAVYSINVLPEIEQMIANREYKMQSFIASIQDRKQLNFTGDEFRNFNSPNDLEMLP